MTETRRLLSNSLIVFIGTLVASAFSYLFNMLMGRMLGPSQYGQMAALFSLLLIVSVSSGAILTVVMKYAGELYHQSHYSPLRRLFLTSSKYIVVVAVFITVVAMLFAWPLAEFFSIDGLTPVLLLFAGIPFGFLTAVNRGILQGSQRFMVLSLTGVLETFIKLLAGVVLVQMGYGLQGALIGVLITSVLTYAVTGIFVLRLFRKLDRTNNGRTDEFSFDKKDILSYTVPSFICTTLLMVALSVDILMVKHLFPEHEAGLYAAVSTVSKIILFTTGPVVSVMFPMVTERKTKGDKHYKLLLLSLLLTLLGGMAILVIYSIMPAKVLTILYGAQYAELYTLLPQVGIAILLYSLINLLANYFMSVRDYVFLWFFAATTIIQVGWMYAWHPSLVIIVRILISTFGLLFFSMMAYYLYTKRAQLLLMFKGEYDEAN